MSNTDMIEAHKILDEDDDTITITKDHYYSLVSDSVILGQILSSIALILGDGEEPKH